MPRYASITDGAIDNIIVASAEYADEHGYIEAPAGVAIGWSYDGATFTAPPDPPIDVSSARQHARLDRFQFASRAAQAGYITYVEAAQWAAGNLIPAAVQAIIDSLPVEQQGPVTLDVLAMPVIRRTGNLMPALAAAFQTDDAGLDALFGLT